MKRKTKSRTLISCLLLTAALAASPLAFSEEAKVEKGGSLEAASDISFTLKTVQSEKKPVELHLRNGKSFKGVVSSVSDHFVVLDKLSGRAFFGAKIRLDSVDAVEVQTSDR